MKSILCAILVIMLIVFCASRPRAESAGDMRAGMPLSQVITNALQTGVPIEDVVTQCIAAAGKRRCIGDEGCGRIEAGIGLPHRLCRGEGQTRHGCRYRKGGTRRTGGCARSCHKLPPRR